MSGASDLANTLATSLLAGTDFSVSIPDFSDSSFDLPVFDGTGIDLTINHIALTDLTSGTIDGTGAFDQMMIAYKAHLRGEYDANRITGAEYTKAYIALTESAMNGAVQFLLGKDQAYWQAIAAQIAAKRGMIELITARVLLEAEKTKLQILRIDALNAQVNYALTKLRLATESVNFDRAKFELDFLLPNQLAIGEKNVERLTAEIAGVNKQNELIEKQITLAQGEVDMLPAKSDMLDKQIEGQENQNALTLKQIDNLTQEINLGPQKLALLIKQVAFQQAQSDLLAKQITQAQNEIDLQPLKENMLQEQVEATRAQTLDTRTDGTPVTGSVGKQKELYSQQITSYQRDAEMKAVKVFTDAWVTMKTIDEGLDPPTMFSNANLDAVLATLKANNDL